MDQAVVGTGESSVSSAVLREFRHELLHRLNAALYRFGASFLLGERERVNKSMWLHVQS